MQDDARQCMMMLGGARQCKIMQDDVLLLKARQRKMMQDDVIHSSMGPSFLEPFMCDFP
jgi:hypothetical protein